MPKATIQDVTDAGFRAEQFGTPPDWATASTGYVQRVIDDAATWAMDKAGAGAYNAATRNDQPAAFLRLKHAELCYVRSILWRRRAAFLDANAFSSLEGNPSASTERSSYLKHAEEADICAAYNLDLFLSSGDSAAPGSGATLGYIETGAFPIRTTAFAL